MHFYTTSVAELAETTSGDWTLEGIAYYAYATPPPGLNLKPLHRLWNNDFGDHLYTIDDAEVQSAQAAGYIYESMAAWVFPIKIPQGQYPGLTVVPLYRLYNSDSGEHFYTTYEQERDFVVNLGFSYEGIACCVLKNPPPESYTPADIMFRLYRTKDGFWDDVWNGVKSTWDKYGVYIVTLGAYALSKYFGGNAKVEKDEKTDTFKAQLLSAKPDVNQPALQPGWACCKKCSGLFYDGHSTKGKCSEGGEHEGRPGGRYNLYFARPPGILDFARDQEHWRWCSKCEGLFFDGHSTKGKCPEGYRIVSKREHDSTESGEYRLHFAPGPGTFPSETSWRWCQKCEGLYSGSPQKMCPAGGKHNFTGSGEYCLYFVKLA